MGLAYLSHSRTRAVMCFSEEGFSLNYLCPWYMHILFLCMDSFDEVTGHC